MHDMECNDRGAPVAAPRGGTVEWTWMDPRLLAFFWNMWCTIHASYSMLAAVFEHLTGVPTTRAAMAAAIGAANRSLARPASMIRQKMDALRDYGEIDEGVRKMMVWDKGGRGRGGGAGGGTALPPTRPSSGAWSAGGTSTPRATTAGT